MNKLRHMFPGQAEKQTSHADAANTILSGKGRHTDIAFGKALARFNHLLFGELGNGDFGSSGVAILGYFVRHIISICAKKQMGWIHAGRIVASMANMHMVRDWAVRQLPRNAVSRNDLIVKSGLPVTLAICVPLPLPTIVKAADLDLHPEMFRGRWGATKASVMPVNKPFRFTFHVAAPIFVSCGNGCLLSTTAVAITVGNIVRGIMGLHKNLHFLCQAQDAANVAGQLLLGSTPVSIPQEGAK